NSIPYIENNCPDIIIMDIELPGINGIEATKQLKQKYPKLQILILTVYENSELVFQALCNGASGYLTKNIKPNEIISSLEQLVNGGAPMSIKIAKMVVESFQKNLNSILSNRELDVLRLLASGKSYKSIANTLCISLNTIKWHIRNIYDKLQVNNREDAIQKANDSKII
ncbi:MAG: response regulator transcription factor, partial [Bacteroidota bacterium]